MHRGWRCFTRSDTKKGFAPKAIPREESSETALAFFKNWAEQVRLNELPDVPEFLDAQTLEFRSNVLGCNPAVKLPNNEASVFLAEAYLRD